MGWGEWLLGPAACENTPYFLCFLPGSPAAAFCLPPPPAAASACSGTAGVLSCERDCSAASIQPVCPSLPRPLATPRSQVERPDGKPETLGLKQLDEPAAVQSDPTVLDLQLRAVSKTATLEPMTVCWRGPWVPFWRTALAACVPACRMVRRRGLWDRVHRT